MTDGKMVSILADTKTALMFIIMMSDIAKLAISIARKMNALIFLVPEDIVDVRPRLVRSPTHDNVEYSLIPGSARF